MLSSNFLNLHLMFFSVPESSEENHITFSSPAPLDSSYLWEFLRLSLSLMTLTVLRKTRQVFYRISCDWDLSVVLPWLAWIHCFSIQPRIPHCLPRLLWSMTVSHSFLHLNHHYLIPVDIYLNHYLVKVVFLGLSTMLSFGVFFSIFSFLKAKY